MLAKIECRGIIIFFFREKNGSFHGDARITADRSTTLDQDLLDTRRDQRSSCIGIVLEHCLWHLVIVPQFPHLRHWIRAVGSNQNELRNKALNANINFHYPDSENISISIDETNSLSDIEHIAAVFGVSLAGTGDGGLGNMTRTSPILTHPIFRTYHTESKMMRYIKRLENKDLSLVHSMISLGSCTSKAL